MLLTRSLNAQITSKTKSIFESNSRLFNEQLNLAKTGNQKGAYNVGEFYSRGIGVTQDYKNAIFWYTNAAKLGDKKAYYKLGLIYKYGKGVLINYKKAFEYFKKSSDMGYPPACYSLGYLFYKGIGCNQSYDEAFVLFTKAADANIHEAMYFKGLAYRNGYGVSPNENLAKQWLTLAARKGNTQASSELLTNTPEFNYASKELKEKREKVEKQLLKVTKAISSDKKTTNLNSSNSSDREFFPGIYKGYLIRYDWSGKHIIDIKNISLKLNDNGTSGLWEEEDGLSTNFLLKKELNYFRFVDVFYKRADHYNAIPQVIKFEKATINQFNFSDSTALVGEIEFYAPEKKEPDKPHKFIVIKRNSKSINFENLSFNGTDDRRFQKQFSVFPNPFVNDFNIEFSIKLKTNVAFYIYNSIGNKVSEVPSRNYLAGNYKISHTLYQLPGIYFIKMIHNNKEIQSLRIIKK